MMLFRQNGIRFAAVSAGPSTAIADGDAEAEEDESPAGMVGVEDTVGVRD
jgi:hypothetical protein